jgi:hypothetical protein
LAAVIIDLVGGLQNLMDAEMQMYQYNRACNSTRRLIKRGNFLRIKSSSPPTSLSMSGPSPDATVEPLKIDTTALAELPN